MENAHARPASNAAAVAPRRDDSVANGNGADCAHATDAFRCARLESIASLTRCASSGCCRRRTRRVVLTSGGSIDIGSMIWVLASSAYGSWAGKSQGVGIASEQPSTFPLFAVHREAIPGQLRRFPGAARRHVQHVAAPRVRDFTDHDDLFQLADATDAKLLVSGRKVCRESAAADRCLARSEKHGVVRHQAEQAGEIAGVDGVDPFGMRFVDVALIRSHLQAPSPKPSTAGQFIIGSCSASACRTYAYRARIDHRQMRSMTTARAIPTAYAARSRTSKPLPSTNWPSVVARHASRSGV